MQEGERGLYFITPTGGGESKNRHWKKKRRTLREIELPKQQKKLYIYFANEELKDEKA